MPWSLEGGDDGREESIIRVTNNEMQNEPQRSMLMVHRISFAACQWSLSIQSLLHPPLHLLSLRPRLRSRSRSLRHSHPRPSSPSWPLNGRKFEGPQETSQRMVITEYRLFHIPTASFPFWPHLAAADADTKNHEPTHTTRNVQQQQQGTAPPAANSKSTHPAATTLGLSLAPLAAKYGYIVAEPVVQRYLPYSRFQVPPPPPPPPPSTGHLFPGTLFNLQMYVPLPPAVPPPVKVRLRMPLPTCPE